MKFLLNYLLLALLTCPLAISAQEIYKPSAASIATLPNWAQEMYSDNPNVLKVDSLYNTYFASNPYVKSAHTEYYRIWRHKNQDWIGSDGFIHQASPQEQIAKYNIQKQNHATARSTSNWNLVGPQVVYDESATRVGEQTNVYSISECSAHPNWLYCGTEPGEIYRSTNAGNTWSLVSPNDPMNGGITAIAVDPIDSLTCFVGSGNFIFKTSDGGNTWNAILSQSNLGPNEILIHPTNTQTILVAATQGFYKSTNGGVSWSHIFTSPCYDVKLRPGANNVVYLLKNNPTAIKCEFLLSSDTGTSFMVQTNGWYNSSDPMRSDGGARLAVSPNNSNRVYAYLIGNSKANDYDFIGVYRSDDGGITWTLPNGPDGGPYNYMHPNLAYGNASWTYDQGFYNCAIMADPNNADAIIIGGLNIWRSDDGGMNFDSVAGYIGGPMNIHVDQQDFRNGVNGTWITNDGGIYFSTDFFRNNEQTKMDGVHGSEFWGFDTGWNEDVMVGGCYHNGTVSHYENYPSGSFLQLGGGEPASGYVNPGENRKVYSSDIGGAILPTSLGLPIQRFSVGMWPNESYYSSESSEMVFDPRCYNIVWLGKENKIFKSIDGGGSYNLVNAFGTNVNARISYFEIAQSDPNTMYVVQRPASGNIGKIWKTIDGGTTWNQLTIPAGTSSRIDLSVSSSDADSLWIDYPSGSNGNKVFLTGNGGTSWNNLTTAVLDNEEGRWIQNIAATNGGVYYITANTIYYRNNSMSNWIVDNNGLPVYINSLNAKPFYRDGKIRVSTYGRGVWENVLNDQPSHPIAEAQVDKLNYTINCAVDSFHFEDHSELNHAGATWQWFFPGGSPTSSTQRNPSVLYSSVGNYIATLIVTDASAQTDTATLAITVSTYVPGLIPSQDFQNSFPPTNWWLASTPSSGQWTLSNAAGGFGNSTQSMLFDNYNFDAQGGSSDFRIRADMTQLTDHKMFFDVAYSLYGYPYSDTLSVNVSTDCGATFTTLYSKGGATLATAPSLQSSTFVPAAAEWRTDSVDLSAWMTHPDLMIAIRNTGYFGQAIYLDNINIGHLIGIHEHQITNGNAALFPNPSLSGQVLTLQSDKDEKFTVEIFNSEGEMILREQHRKGDQVFTGKLAKGTYVYRLTGETMIRNNYLIVQ